MVSVGIFREFLGPQKWNYAHLQCIGVLKHPHVNEVKYLQNKKYLEVNSLTNFHNFIVLQSFLSKKIEELLQILRLVFNKPLLKC